MSVIIRLQNLAWSANALDIRRLFHGLAIPDGGVHIVGGENGDAFIAFSSDEDARKAMHLDGALLLQNPVKLYLSSKNEMQNVIAIARNSTPAPEAQGSGRPPMDPNGGFPMQNMDRGAGGFNNRSQLPPPQMGFQAPPGPQNNGPFGNRGRDEPPFNDDTFGRPTMNAPQPRRGPSYDGPDGRRDTFGGGMPDDFGGNDPRMGPRGMDDSRMNRRRDMPPEVDMRGDTSMRGDLRVEMRGGDMRDMRGDIHGPRPGILGDSPMNFNQSNDMPQRKILLADPMPDRQQMMMPGGGFQPDNGMMHLRDEGFMRGPQERDWPDRDDFRRRDRDGRRSRMDDGGPGGFRDRSPIRRDFDRDRRPHGMGPGRDDHNVCLFISGMPTNISYRDVRRFFTGCPIPSTGLKMINDEYGRRKGSAYIMFSSEQVTDDALMRNGSLMNGQPIQVDRCSRQDFEKAIDSFVPGRGERRDGSPPRRSGPGSSEGNYHIEVRNVPFRAVRTEIKHFFSGLRISSGPIMDIAPDGRFSGVVYMQLQDRRDLRDAMDFNGRNFMGRPLEIVEISHHVFESKNNKERRGRDREPRESRRDSKSERVSDSIEMKDSKEVKTEKKEDDKDKIREETKSPAKTEESGSSGSHEKFYCVKLDGLPYLCNNVAVKDFFEGLEIAQRGIHLNYNERHQCMAIGYVEFVTSSDCEKALKKNKEYMGRRFILVEPITKRDMLDAIARDRNNRNNDMGGSDRGGRGRGRGGMGSGGRGGSRDGMRGDFRSEGPGRGFGGDMSHFDDRRVERGDFYNGQSNDFNGRDDRFGGGVVVAMYNVPFRANVQDVVDFFRGFPVMRQSVQILRTPEGRMTGEVNVSLPTMDDAVMVVGRLDHQDFMGRSVELCIL